MSWIFIAAAASDGRLPRDIAEEIVKIQALDESEPRKSLINPSTKIEPGSTANQNCRKGAEKPEPLP